MPAPFRAPAQTLQPDWIDYNGHLNMAYYMVLFDRGADYAFAEMGLGPEYLERSGHSFFSAEAHIRYLREVPPDASVAVEFRILEHDPKRIHQWMELVHEDGWVAATCEIMTLHVDMERKKVSPFPDDVAELIERMARDHASLPKPEGVGCPIGIRR